jgi:hypothetical protein
MQTFAQKIGIQGGINLTNMLMKDDEDTYSDEFEMNLGYNGGVTVEFGFSDLLALEAGIMADSKGFKWETDMFGPTVTTKVNLWYIDVPVLVKVGPTLGPVKIFGAAGPYIGYGIAGKYKMEADGEEESEDVNWGSDEESDFKPLDYGAKFGIGAESMGFTFGAYYSLGLANCAVETDGGYKESHKFFSFSVGYKFGK